MNIRVIPRLDIKGPNLVKGVHLEGLRVLGRPERFARYYYENGADELIYMDVVASLYGRNSLLDVISVTSKETFIPLTVGGGIRTVEDIKDVLQAGADKVAINTAAIQRPEFINEAARKFGSSTIVVSIEALKKTDGEYEAYTDNGRERTGIDAVKWAIDAASQGAGEILVTAIHQEGTGNGFDVELTRLISERVSVPVIAGGGAGKLDHIKDAIEDGKADAISVASVLHYKFLDDNNPGDIVGEGNTEFLRDKKGFSRIGHFTLREIKDYLSEFGISCRGTYGDGQTP